MQGSSFRVTVIPSGMIALPNGSDSITAHGSLTEAASATRFLAIMAHQDDVEISALHGILHGRTSTPTCFSAVICSASSYSPSPQFQTLPTAEILATRRREQREAALLGGYRYCVQLPFPSGDLKGSPPELLVTTLATLIAASPGATVYTHNPFDRHPTHLTVCAAVLAACRRLGVASRPRQVLGCEGWRNLDWLPSDLKVRLPIVDPDRLGEQLVNLFRSQVTNGKRYAEAAVGRRVSQATFDEATESDAANEVTLAVDLTHLIASAEPLTCWCEQVLSRFRAEIIDSIEKTRR